MAVDVIVEQTHVKFQANTFDVFVIFMIKCLHAKH